MVSRAHVVVFFFFSSRRRHTRCSRDWSSDVCSSDLKNGFPGALVGLSGGVDSALTLCIACDALGPERVRAVMMPSQYTSRASLEDSRELAKNLRVRYDEIPIGPAFDAFLALLAREVARLPVDATEENLQARIRGTLLMALSNKFGAIVLTTGNKSKM